MSVLFTITFQHLVQVLGHSRCSLNICGLKEYVIALGKQTLVGVGVGWLGGGGWGGGVGGCSLK